ncbi:MAG: di-heme enzyme [Phycisphaerales bacterium]|nr:di-heme enzyme [Phycisphaerales bacterium]
MFWGISKNVQVKLPLRLIRILRAMVLCGLCGCTPAPFDNGNSDNGAGNYKWDLPPGYPVPLVPDDNPMTKEKVELGRHLFYDVRLSGNETQSCSTCHIQEFGFADGVVNPVGSTGDIVPRNSPGLANVAYYTSYTWSSKLLRKLEQQTVIPMFGESPVELGITGRDEEVLNRFSDDPAYQKMFSDAFPDDENQISFDNIIKALSCFLRTMIAGNSPWDRATYQGDSSALSASARRGSELFFSERLECLHCHGGFNFTQATQFEGTAFQEFAFHNTGLYNIDGEGAYPASDTGLIRFTGNPDDMGKFRAPSLHNIMVTAPYFHDGSVATIDDVLDIYAAGGRNIEDGPNAGDGRENPFKSGFLRGFNLTTQEREDLRAFFEALTDESFLADPRFSNPLDE